MTQRLTLWMIAMASMAMCCLSTRPGYAQVPDARSSANTLFGSVRARPEQTQFMNLAISAFDSFDTQPLAGEIGGPATRGLSRYDPGVQADLRYNRKGRTLSISLDTDTVFRYYAGLGGLSTISHSVNGGFSADLGRRTHLQLQESVRTSPFYLVTIAPDSALLESPVGTGNSPT
jgi:hypothetical protein